MDSVFAETPGNLYPQSSPNCTAYVWLPATAPDKEPHADL
jgi:hypothetical protein